MKKIVILEKEYELLKDEGNIFNLNDVESLMTDYFTPYDYVLGDFSYGKLRLKGFYDSNNKKVNKINNFNDVDRYLKEFCSFKCKYFILKKIKK